MTDEALVKGILDGYKNLFEQIIRRYNQRLYRIGMTILNDETETEDAMQNAYISAYEHLSQFSNRSQFSTWLTRIMLNQCYAQKRKKQSLELVAPGEGIHFTNLKTPAHIMANKELNGILQDAIAQLPEKYRLIFVLREIEDLSVRETSEALSIEETNVKVRLNRAKTLLKNNLNGYLKDEVYNLHLNRCDAMVNLVMNRIRMA